MSLELITGAANVGKTGILVASALRALADGRTPTLVVPRLLDVRRLESELAGKAGLGVRVSTIDQFITETWALYGDGRRLVGRQAREAAIRAVAHEHRHELPLHPESPGVVRLLCRLAEISSTRRLSDPPAVVGSTRLLQRMLLEYAEQLKGDGLIERAWTVDLLARAAPKLAGPVGMARFDTLSRLELDLVLALAHNNDLTAAITWAPGLAATSANKAIVERIEALGCRHTALGGGVAAGEIQELAEALYQGPVGLSSRGAVELAVGSGTEGEIALVAAAVARAVASGTPPERVAIVFPSVATRRDALVPSLLSHGVVPEFDSAPMVNQTTFGRAFLLLLRLGDGRGGRSDANFFVGSPYSECSRAKAEELDRGWRRTRTVQGGSLLLDIAGAAKVPELSAARKATDLVRRGLGRENAAKWQELPATMLAAAVHETGDAETQSQTLDGLAFTALSKALSQIAEVATEPVDSQVVERMVSTVRLGGANEEVGARVRVVDAGSVGARRFDVMVVGGLTDGEFSIGSHGSLEDELVATFGEPPADSAEIARLRFYGLVSRAREKLVLVRQDADSDGRQLRPAEFWEDVVDAYRPLGADAEDLPALQPTHRLARSAIEDAAPCLTSLRAAERRAAAARIFGSPQRDSIDADLAVGAFGADRVFSPTEIESYLSCPYRWFYERVVRPDEIDAEFDARELGTRAHGVLAEFYRRLQETGPESRVRPDGLGSALSLFEDVAASTTGRTVPRSLAEELAAARVHAWARAVIEQDAELLPGFAPVHVELAFGVDEPFAFGGVLMRGSIDRIDEAPVAAVVTDYKSSRAVPGFEKFEDEGRIQAVVYATAAAARLGKPIAGSVYRSLSSGALRGYWRVDLLGGVPRGMCENDALDEAGARQLVERTEERVAAAVEGIRAGRVPRKAAVKGACAFCAISATCEGARA